jgi:predicted transcriptional regulator of viral defense system
VPHVDDHYGPKGAAPHADRVIAEVASRLAGVVGHGQLVAHGVTVKMIRRRVESGQLVPIHRGVYAVGGLVLATRSRRWAAQLAYGDHAAISHRTALDEHDIRPDRRITIDVTLPRRARPRRDVIAHEAALEPCDVTKRNGLRTTSLPRTLLDAAALLPTGQITKALERADKLDLLDVRAIDAVCRRYRGHRGERRLSQALDAYDPRHHQTRSDWERDVLELVDALGIPRPQVNARLGPYEFDLYWPEPRVVVELQSWEHHGNRPAFENDNERARWLALNDILLTP